MLFKNRRSGFLLVCFSLIILLVGASTWIIVSNNHNRTQTPKLDGTAHSVTQGVSVSGPVSPLVFGTNLGLFNTNDQVLTSATTRTLLQQTHTQIIRMPFRSSLSNTVEIQAAQTIKALGATPLIILHSIASDSLSVDTRIVNDMNTVFGNSIVYYEYGNEDDFSGTDAATYTQSWNQVIPALKQLAHNGRFIGPVNYQYDSTYLTTFLQGAKPRPDAISWHEYTCDDSWADNICLSHIDHWTTHIADARSVMVSITGTILPIMITEWNYAPNAVYNDGKNNDSAFMTAWTTKALQTLAANRVFASMQYSCTNTAIPLVDSSNTLTTQGSVFQSVYQEMIVKGQQPAPVTSPITGIGQTPIPTHPITLPIGSQVYSFEDGTTDGWAAHGSGISNVQNATNLAYNSKHSLKATLANASNGDYPYLSVSPSNNAPTSGQTITIFAYLATNSVTVNAKILIVDANNQWLTGDFTQLVPGTWTSLTYTVPSGLSGPISQIGVQFNNPSGSNISSDVYIDAIGWR